MIMVPVRVVVPTTVWTKGAADEESGVSVISAVIWISIISVIGRWCVITPAYRSTYSETDKDSCLGGRQWNRQSANAHYGNQNNGKMSEPWIV